MKIEIVEEMRRRVRLTVQDQQARDARVKRIAASGLGAGAVVLALGCLTPLVSCFREPPVHSAPRADYVTLAASAPAEPEIILNDQQKRPPCGKGELEIAGGCWVSLEQKPPECPMVAVPWQGRCLVAVGKPAPRPPSSVGP